MLVVDSNFEKATDFIPERWTTRPEMIRNKAAHQPFNLGRHSCPGKNIAMMELRLVIATLVTTFDVSLAPGETGKGLTENLSDCFTALAGEVYLKFKPI